MSISEEDSSQFISRVGDSSGGQYSINMKTAFTQLTWATLENIVMERFGSKAARIFRCVLF
jgi:DNA-directed RNA polymerase III subunit RPC3